jgi:ribosomal protein L16 Arg81 hydroxylase
MSPHTFSFETLIAPLRPREFYEQYWEKQPLVIKRHDAASYYRDLFSLADVDKYVHTVRETTREVAIIPPPERGQKSRRQRFRDLAMDTLYDAYCAGETIRLESIQEAWPPVTNLAAHVGGALGAGVNVNVYMTPAHSQGLSVHFDTHDVFILQVDGAKDWWLYESDVQLPVEVPTYLKHLGAVGEKKVDEKSCRLRETLRLETGDLLYIPRGFPHKAATPDRPSVHLALAIAPVYWIDLIRTAIERLCIDDRDLRRALPPGFVDDPDLREAMRTELTSLLRRCAERASAGGAVEGVLQDRIGACRYPPDGHFAELARLDTLALGDRVERRAGVKCVVRTAADGASIHFSMNQVRGPRTMAPALEYIRDHASFRAADLPGALGDSSKLVLVRRLIREGLLRRGAAFETDTDNAAPAFAAEAGEVCAAGEAR